MASQLRSREFRDISLSFEPHPVTKDIPVLRDTACIRKSVSNIVQTIRGERFFDSLFGSNVRRSLFDFVDFATASVIEREITEAILNHTKGKGVDCTIIAAASLSSRIVNDATSYTKRKGSNTNDN